MRFAKFAGASLLLVLASVRAEAVVVAFDVPSSETIFTSQTIEGFHFTSQHFHVFGDGYFASNGTTYLGYEGIRGFPVTMTMVGGGTFALLGLDGAESMTTDTQGRPPAEQLGIEGHRADGSIVDIHIPLDGFNDGGARGSANDFQHFTLPSSFSGLVSVRFYGVRSDGRDGGVSLDNLIVDAGGTIPGCGDMSVGHIPLTDLGTGSYNGFGGGLYPGGANVRPAAHESDGLLMAAEIMPRDSLGQVDAVNGHIGFISVGMSNTNQEFEVFEFASNADANRNPMVTTVNGAQSGQNASQWANPASPAWTGLATAIANKGLTAAQVQVAWIKLADSGQDVGGWGSYAPFPATAALLQTNLRSVVRTLKSRYPNLKIAYLSSRIYGGHAGDEFPEPVAYEEGFGVKWLIEEQMGGAPELSYAGSGAPAPFLAWGPYLWADGVGSDGVIGGIPGRLDGLEYACQDFVDGTSPSPFGRQKVADQLLNFLSTDTTSALWYVDSSPPPTSGTPYYLDLDGVDDHLTVADADGLSFGNGSVDTPLTFEAWIRPDSLSVKQNLISKWQDGANAEYRLHIASGSLRLDLKDGGSSAVTSAYAFINQSVPVGTWHHIAVTYDGRGGAGAANGISFFLDGAVIPVTRANNASYIAMGNKPVALQLGRESTSFKQYNGAFDEMRLWNLARSQSQIQASMASELSGSESGLVAYWRFNEGTDITVADDSNFNHLATLRNDPTWVAGGPMNPPAADTTPPVISNIAATNLTDTSVTIAFDTNETTHGWISHTQNTSCPCTDTYDPNAGTHHVITLTGLTPDTTYSYEAKATDLAGNFQVAPRTEFRTFVPSDTTAPSVSLTSPVAGTVTGSILLEAIASDSSGVAGVQFKVNGVPVGAEIVVPPYSLTWDSTTVGNGPRTISAEARDAAGNIGTSSVVVSVANQISSGTPYYLVLDGVDDHLTVDDADSLSFGNGSVDTPLTFEAWIRPDTLSVKQNLVSKWQDGVNAEYKLHIAAGSLRLDLRDGASSAVTSAYAFINQAVAPGTWHHVAVTYDGRGGAGAAGGITVYVDGNAMAMVRINNASYVAMGNRPVALQLGRESTNFKQYDGALDELRLWNVARSQGQIQASMVAELSGTESGLVAYWRFNEGTGLTVADDSPFDHLATLRNNPAWAPGGALEP